VAIRVDESQRLLLAGGVAIGFAIATGVVVAGIVGFLSSRPAIRPLQAFVAHVERAVNDPTDTQLVVRVGARDLDAAAASVNDAITQRRAADAAQRRLIADVAHELRTPLTSLQTNAQLLELDEQVDAETRDIARRLVATSRAAAQLVSGIVDYAGARAWEPAGDERAHTGDVCSRAIMRVSERWPDISIPRVGAGVDVCIDANVLERVISNLLDNAIVHGAAPIGIELSNFGDIVVRDGGGGDDFSGDIFAPFHSSSTSPGRGLGLAFVREAIRAAGGSIEVQRTASGTQFVIALPVANELPNEFSENS
jgi:signal transduction histidine kinase